MEKIWIYQSDKQLSDQETKEIGAILNEFCSTWNAHGQPLDAHSSILYNRFILLTVDESSFGASGCSIDASVRIIREIEKKYLISLFDRTKMAFLRDDVVNTCDLNELEALFQDGTIKIDTVVFDNSIQYASDLDKNWKKQFSESGYFNLR